MAPLDTATEALRDFLRAEHEARLALWTDRDQKAVEAKVAALNKTYFSGSLTSGLHRRPGASEQYFEDGAHQAENAKVRDLFKVEEYRHPTEGTLVRGVVSQYWTEGTSYASAFVLRKKGSRWKIVSLYNLCGDCNGTGKVGGRKCGGCGGAGWINRGGEEIDDLGELVTVRKLMEPTDPDHLAEYEATG